MCIRDSPYIESRVLTDKDVSSIEAIKIGVLICVERRTRRNRTRKNLNFVNQQINRGDRREDTLQKKKLDAQNDLPLKIKENETYL